MNRRIHDPAIKYSLTERQDIANAGLDKYQLSNSIPICILKGVPNVRFKYHFAERQIGG